MQAWQIVFAIARAAAGRNDHSRLSDRSIHNLEGPLGSALGWLRSPSISAPVIVGRRELSELKQSSGSSSEMSLQDAFTLFRRLGVNAETISRAEFNAAYIGLARRYHQGRQSEHRRFNGEHQPGPTHDSRILQAGLMPANASRLAGIAAAPSAPLPHSTPHR